MLYIPAFDSSHVFTSYFFKYAYQYSLKVSSCKNTFFEIHLHHITSDETPTPAIPFALGICVYNF
jgi:hypothetical protein